MKIIRALVKKEFFQIIRDPSSILIAFILPFVLLTIFAVAINLDNNQIKAGLVVEGDFQQINSLTAQFEGTDYLNITRYPDRPSAVQALVRGDIKAFVVIPVDFTKQLNGVSPSPIQVVTDASDPNMALFISSYAQGVVTTWTQAQLYQYGQTAPFQIQVLPTVWFNPELKSKYFILPGSIAVIMTLVGMILTALVIAREWERGTMEALLTTRAGKLDILVSKYISYYGLAILSSAFCSFLCIAVYDVPFRGSYLIYFVVSSLFILTALGQGFIVSTLAKNQFLAAITSASFGFLPAVMLSGFLFEIASMPKWVQLITYVVPARYFIPQINSLFLAGNIVPLLITQSLYLIGFNVVLFTFIYRVTPERLE